MDNDPVIPAQRISRKTRRILLSSIILVMLVYWILNTPPGLLGKTDAVGYAVCHRITSHSFYFGDRPFSFCARCTGQYLGFLWGFLYQIFWSRKRSGFPPKAILAFMGVLFLIYALDGFNSVLHLYPGFQHLSLYEPLNSLRLFSGLGMGMVVSVIMVPLIGQSILRDPILKPVFKDLKQWGIIFGGGLNYLWRWIFDWIISTYWKSTDPLSIDLIQRCRIDPLFVLVVRRDLDHCLKKRQYFQFLEWIGLVGFGRICYRNGTDSGD